ncbi:Tetratricopeptide repeat protein [compost metagenome]
MSIIFKYRKTYLIMALILFNVMTVFAQKKDKLSTILATATLDIYEKPDRVIKIGDSIYKSPTSSNEVKIRALRLISNAYASKRDYQKSLKYFLKANALSKNTGDIYSQINILSQTGVKYQQMGVYDKAIQYLDESDKLIATLSSKDFARHAYTQASNYIVRGFIYKDQLNCDIAINYFDKGIALYKKRNTDSEQPNLSIAYYNKGNCYITMSDYAAAKKSFLEAIAFAENVNANSLKAFAQKGLAEVYTKEGNYTKAIEILEEALEISKNVGDLVLNRGVYIALANNYLAVNDWQQYQKYNKLFLNNQLIIKESERRSINDSIDELTQINDQKLEEVKTKYVYIISILVLSIFVMLYLLYRYQKRSISSIDTLNLEVKRIKATLKSND